MESPFNSFKRLRHMEPCFVVAKIRAVPHIVNQRELRTLTGQSSNYQTTDLLTKTRHPFPATVIKWLAFVGRGSQP